jgi:rhomboid protease GluP
MVDYFQRKRNNNFLRNFSFFMPKMNATLLLIIINVIVFVISAILGFFSNPDCSQTVCNYLALQPNNLFLNNYWWTLITSVFVHANFFHLFVNMFSLFFIGRFLEMIIGKKRFFWIYIFSGIFAGLFFCFLAWFAGNNDILIKIFNNKETFAVGASGALFGIAGVLAFLVPKNKVYLIMGPILAIILEAILMQFIENSSYITILSLIINIYIIIAVFSMFSINSRLRLISLPLAMPFWMLPIAAVVPLIVIGFFVNLPIGNMAHLGGFILGACYGIYLRLRYKKKTQIICDYFSRCSQY